MRVSNETGHRPGTMGFLAAVLLPSLLACGEPTRVLPDSVPSMKPAPTLIESVYLADADGTVLGRLTDGSWPSWSPDSRRIVFHRDGHVRVIGADGEGEIELATGEWPTWSPDGQRIAFATREGGISVMNADGSAARAVMSPALAVLAPNGVGKLSWSPDGALIAFERFGDEDGFIPTWIFAMTVDGATHYYLAAFGGYERDPAWSPRGSRVLYINGPFGISVVERGGGEPTLLYTDARAFSISRPSWSPDGRKIGFSTQERVPVIMSVSVDGSDEGPLTIGKDARVLIRNGFHPAWSPDGRYIAFVRVDER